MLIGRHKEIYGIVNMLNNPNGERIIQVKGINGMGINAIAKYAADYCITRDSFIDGAYIFDTEGKHTTHSFESMLLQVLGPYKNTSQLIEEYHSR